MANITINTTQNVNINFPLAEQGQRVAAHLIDVTIKAIYIYAVIMIIETANIRISLDGWSINAIYVISLAPAMFYSLLFEYFNEGRTPGKLLMRTRVVKIDGYQADFIDILTRWAMRIIDIQFGFGLIGLIAMSRNAKRQRLGDIAAGTSVISVKNTVEFTQTIFEDIRENYIPTYPQVIRLSDNDIRIIKNNLITSRHQNDAILIIQLRDKVQEILGIQTQEDPYVFIETVIRDYNYYTKNG